MTGFDFVTQFMTQKQMLHRHVLSASDAKKEGMDCRLLLDSAIELRNIT